MWEAILVVAIVGVAAYFAVRSVYRDMAGKSKTCACGLDACPLNQDGQCDPSKNASRRPQEPQPPSQ